MLATILIILGIILMVARGSGLFVFAAKPLVDLGWIGLALVCIGAFLIK